MGLDSFRRRRRWLFLVGGLLALSTLVVRWQHTLPRSLPHVHLRPGAP